ncbi:ATP-dependent protease La [Cokeromyces recurvatus]|uniref:ATP-dependent protease La n=1 Tax=Cokeromyces recurvatus TaxID=90255 RepID=UPI002220A6AB|nr:ATP-dependent protease La [Cokeromyces recurvatus]KAI7899514.1 ATP-dependent protease La [Cokeromyces recurvatus]
MSHSFLIHVSKTIPRSKVNQAIWSQLQSPVTTKPLNLRHFSTCRSQHPISIWGGQNVKRALLGDNANSFCIGLSPIRHAAVLKREASSVSAFELKDRDPKNNPSDQTPPPANNGGHSSNSANGGGSSSNNNNNGDGKSSKNHSWDVVDNQLQKPTVPEVYPQVLALPIAGRPLFPGFYKAVVIKEPTVTAAIKELMKRGQPYVGAFLLKDEALDVDTITTLDQVHKVGVFAQITSVFPASAGKEDSGLTAVLYPHRRIKINELLPAHQKSDPSVAAVKEVITTEEVLGEHEDKQHNNLESKLDEYASSDEGHQNNSQYATSFLTDHYDVSLVNVENFVEPEYSKKSPYIRAVTSEIVSVFKEIASLNPLFRDQIASFSMSQSAGNVFDEPSKLADFAAAVSAGEALELQEVLETLPVEERLQKSLVVLKKELMNAQLQNKISKDVESKIAKRQRDYYLMEQLKGIKKELGLESDGKDKLVEGFKEKANQLAMPATVKKVFEEEINKLAHLEPAASEFNVTRNYLDWITQIPWGRRSRENYNILHATQVLDEDHYGLKDVKDRILEFIAVGKLRGTVEGKILCLAGPPGVGKTSIGKSIARALDREFFRFSVGGLTDVAEIKGHRRTYVGAMPGKVIQALKKVQTENPLILIDEIDKLGRGHQGDPSSALLELLDPEQNSSFLDHYMDVPVDLSKVLFVCTANVLDTIPGPLLDRMEVIQLSGYIAEEKAAIAEKYLAPAAKVAAGLENVNVHLTQEAIDSLIKNYCRESGVRNLKKHIDKVFRKAAFKVVQELGEDKVIEKEEKKENEEMTKETMTSEQVINPLVVPKDVHVDITSENLKEYVGPQVYQSERLYEQTPPGVVMGLAWTSMGGCSLYIESVLESSLNPKSTPHLSKTGQLGDVMKESTSIAYTYAKSLLATEFPKNKFFDKAKVHLHCPAGAVPKDGPSAGVTMATALISLALNKPVSSNIAMTGELTVTGKVLKIGGLKEKTIAAKRSKVTTILFPKDNQADWDELPEYIKEGLTGIPCDTYKDVYNAVFKDVKKEEAENVWKDVLTEKEETSHKK